jgi:hypothetical protein
VFTFEGDSKIFFLATKQKYTSLNPYVFMAIQTVRNMEHTASNHQSELLCTSGSNGEEKKKQRSKDNNH